MTRREIECEFAQECGAEAGPVLGAGPTDARIALIGRNPGRMEIVNGLPFVGPAGRKLDEALKIAGLDRKTLYITNVAKCMFPGDAPPSKSCIKRCVEKYLLKELESLKNLELIITLGNEALQLFLPTARIGSFHGIFFDAERFWKVKVFTSFHPSAALRSAKYDELFLQDWRQLARAL